MVGYICICDSVFLLFDTGWRIGAGKAGYATVVFPVFALLISTVFEAYQWSLLSVLGILLCLAAMS